MKAVVEFLLGEIELFAGKLRVAKTPFIMLMAGLFAFAVQAAPEPFVLEPIKLHPTNPHYFFWRGQPTILITAGEHYGAVLNREFDYIRYLEELKRNRFNLTRIFSGSYREVTSSFNIRRNTLAPSAGKFICPWPRSQTPKASDGNNKFDLAKWDEAYFDRLKDFLKEANAREVVVELVLFCTMYDDEVWGASPMNSRNNINEVGTVDRFDIYTTKDKALLAVQHALVQKLVTELNHFDNLYYEVCNEPYERSGLTKEWNDQIIAKIVETEATLPKKHLIAQGLPPTSSPIAELNPFVSILNFHAATSESVRLNHPLNKVIAYDETGGADRGDRKYRTEGWDFLLAGGGVYDHLDFSFAAGFEDGTAFPLPTGTPGGGGPVIRQQLSILKEFIEGFDFARMVPNDSIIKNSQIATHRVEDSTTKTKTAVRALVEMGKAYAIYVSGGTQARLDVELPAGRYKADWISTKTAEIESTDTFNHVGGSRTIISPVYIEDIALRVVRK